MIDLRLVEAVAKETRHDFERGTVKDDEIIAAATDFNYTHQLRTYVYDPEERDRLVRAGELLVIDGKYFRIPLIKAGTFPNNCCNDAVPLLAQRLVESGALVRDIVELIDGGCGKDKDALDPNSCYDNYHAFVGIGKTALGWDTIVDITADQFGQGLPPVYVGQLKSPWTREPRIELLQY